MQAINVNKKDLIFIIIFGFGNVLYSLYKLFKHQYSSPGFIPLLFSLAYRMIVAFTQAWICVHKEEDTIVIVLGFVELFYRLYTFIGLLNGLLNGLLTDEHIDLFYLLIFIISAIDLVLKAVIAVSQAFKKEDMHLVNHLKNISKYLTAILDLLKFFSWFFEYKLEKIKSN